MSVPIVPLVLGEASPGTITIADLTTGQIDGTGVFDVLMATSAKHLLEEFAKNRITGKEYATVYLGLITVVMQQSIAYLTTAKQVEKLNADIGLIRQQIVSELVRTDNLIPVGLGFNDSTALEGTMAKELLIADKNLEKVTAEVTLIKQQTVTELAQTDDDLIGCAGLNNGLTVEGLIAKQKALIDGQLQKVSRDMELVKQQIVTELAQTDTDIPVGLGFNNSLTVDGLILKQVNLTDKQITKITSEINLLDQKTVTEIAQTGDTLPEGIGLNTSATVTGVTGKQKALYAAQTDGFTRDAEQKVLAEMLKTWAVRRTTDEGTVVPSNIDDSAINIVVAKAVNGIGIQYLT